ncbi:MAG: hypothetical protein JWO04_2468 [Gammaproteobacteria bacterium]|jgi:uncharacterized membrane protein HdeD (DUF308 family)|nr:hypothetical protein [Gammaproteobacteria bacterium]
MATTESEARAIHSAVSAAIHRHWGLFLLEGILLIVLGSLAVLVPAVASVAATIVFGWILLLSGVIGLITTLRARQAPGFGWSLLSAIIGIAAGLVLLAMPVQGTLSLTAVLIAFLLVEGVVSILYAFEHRKGLSGRWSWMLASGIIDVVLALILMAGLPGTAVWALGLLIGINMIFGGWALVWMALHARSEATATA